MMRNVRTEAVEIRALFLTERTGTCRNENGVANNRKTSFTLRLYLLTARRASSLIFSGTQHRQRPAAQGELDRTSSFQG
jgi:hypothetical protein